MTLVAGFCNARATGGALGYTNAGDPQIAIALELIDGESAGESVTWYGYFTDKTKERTFKTLRLLGWEGDDLTDLTGIEKNEVRVQLKEETYQGETSIKPSILLGGGVALRNQMNPQQAKDFARQMKGEAVASRGGGTAPAQRTASPSRNTPPPRQPAGGRQSAGSGRQALPPEAHRDMHPDDGGDDIPF